MQAAAAAVVAWPLAAPSRPRCLRLRHTRRRGAPALTRSAVVAAAAQEGGTIVREVLTREQRQKLNTLSDRDFYGSPRIVTHVDDAFIANLTELYRRRVPAGGRVFDMMSSWVSHLPPEVEYAEVIGHGMNASELTKNQRLDKWFVRDLNADPGFELADQSVNAVLCAVSVQYLQQPEKVFAEIYRVLKPGGVCIMSFSNRMFYDKAIAAWREGTGYSRVQLVKSYFLSVRGFTQPEVITELENPPAQRRDFISTLVKLFQRSSSDPFYAVVSYRNFKPEDAGETM
eukprot:jgi/Chlat1/6145/Chrsp41S05697